MDMGKKFTNLLVNLENWENYKNQNKIKLGINLLKEFGIKEFWDFSYVGHSHEEKKIYYPKLQAQSSEAVQDLKTLFKSSECPDINHQELVKRKNTILSQIEIPAKTYFIDQIEIILSKEEILKAQEVLRFYHSKDKRIIVFTKRPDLWESLCKFELTYSNGKLEQNKIQAPANPLKEIIKQAS